MGKILKIGITGQAGFIGSHLFNFLKLQENVERIKFADEYFESDSKLKEFVKTCDVIVHLAAMNRHNDPEVIYNTNISLVKKLISACEATNSTPHILFSSSTQEERDNSYGKSKKDGRELFIKWAEKNNASFTGFIIPNVFGPFGHPYYNSFIATFCHKLTHNEQPEIQTDGLVKLIYVGELVELIYKHIINTVNKTPFIEAIHVPHTSEGKVSDILSTLQTYKTKYFERGEIPDLTNIFERNLFNTFVCYIDHKNYFPRKFTLNTDNRGSFVETIKLNSGGQVSFSTTKADITRGNHFHTRKAERFAVIKGKAKLELRRIGTNEKLEFIIDAEQNPGYVDMPIWFTHNITNIGTEELYTIFWISEHYNQNDADTFFENV